MMKERSNAAAAGRVCDTCGGAAATVHCRADSAYLCGACDARIHAANRVASRHERVRVCEACERAPAAFLCKADAASLCAACDADIHSANPLASRHHRVPIVPIPGCLCGPAAPERGCAAVVGDTEDGEDEAASWLLLKNTQLSNGFLVDEYLDLVEYDPRANQNHHFTNQYNNEQQRQQQQQQHCIPRNNYGVGDSVVPVQPKQQHQQFQSINDYTAPKAYSYKGSFNCNVSVSSMEAVPKPTMSDISISHPILPKGTIDIFSIPPIQILTQLTPMDREARVLRYREKKKSRKFQKTIRYASRKAYAETRPRIKGRFAKRTEAEIGVDQMFSTTMMGESGYGVVPSF